MWGLTLYLTRYNGEFLAGQLGLQLEPVPGLGGIEAVGRKVGHIVVGRL